ncbi:unnamed protein product [Penicillium camemberti]|uniref:Str. FM013 n=1 Tax=Penicillium camemberti (strain FM 013) TaxID=1429867 RepID=A0A0G4PPL8_PENC3|nr:unnamed protein product [Penicillium camemberti]
MSIKRDIKFVRSTYPDQKQAMTSKGVLESDTYEG